MNAHKRYKLIKSGLDVFGNKVNSIIVPEVQKEVIQTIEEVVEKVVEEVPEAPAEETKVSKKKKTL